MTEYHATEEDMRAYCDIIHSIATLDLQRKQLIDALASWEQAHIVPEPEPEEDPLEPQE